MMKAQDKITIIAVGLVISVGIGLGNLLDVEWGFAISLKAIGLAFGVVAIIGLVFGVYPARKAAQLSPIDALRYE